jgi:hypothetical protein
VLLRLDDFAQLLPLFLGWVDTGRVLSASVEQDLISAYFRMTLGSSRTYNGAFFGVLIVSYLP